jgi:BASS family bile acid:Na+ symporter
LSRASYWFAATSSLLHRHFLGFLAASYVLAAFWPGPGLWIRNVSLAEFNLFREKTLITLPMAMLALLLVNAGLGIQTSQLNNLLHKPRALILGLIANLVIPILFIFLVSQLLRLWHNPDEVQTILVGLALVASMPIAGSSTAWAQNSNANLALSLGLVLFSTFLSPLTTPVALHSVGWMAQGEYARELHGLAGYGTGAFLLACVLVPSVLGIAGHAAAGDARVAAVKPSLKLLNSGNLLILNYSNAAVSLPQMVAFPDWDFVGMLLLIVVSLCGLAFVSGWVIGRLMQLDRSQQAALVFGLGMNNNGTGLVLASLTLAAHPRVLLPIIIYNLVQHLGAGIADFLLSRREPDHPPPEAGASGAGFRNQPAIAGVSDQDYQSPIGFGYEAEVRERAA